LISRLVSLLLQRFEQQLSCHRGVSLAFRGAGNLSHKPLQKGLFARKILLDFFGIRAKDFTDRFLDKSFVRDLGKVFCPDDFFRFPPFLKSSPRTTFPALPLMVLSATMSISFAKYPGGTGMAVGSISRSFRIRINSPAIHELTVLGELFAAAATVSK